MSTTLLMEECEMTETYTTHKDQSNISLIIDANIIIPKGIAECNKLLSNTRKDSGTYSQLYQMSIFYEYQIFLPEKVYKNAKNALKEICKRIGKEKGKQVEIETQIIIEDLEKALENAEITILPEKDYKNFLLQAIEIFNDPRDDAHVIAAALYLKNIYKLQTIYIWSRDGDLVEIEKKLLSFGIIVITDPSCLIPEC